MGTMVKGWPRVKLPMSSGAEMEKRRVRAGWRDGNEGAGGGDEDIQGLFCAMRSCRSDVQAHKSSIGALVGLVMVRYKDESKRHVPRHLMTSGSGRYRPP